MTLRLAVLSVIVLLACGGEPESLPDDTSNPAPAPAFEAPVLTNAGVPIAYPPGLYEDGVEGRVVLRLFADETGAIVPESTVVAEGSGYPELDSAALAGVGRMRFAPARRAGVPVAAAFLQPVQFQRLGLSSGGDSQP